MRSWLLLIAVLFVTSCARSQAPAPAPTPTPALAAAPAASPAAAAAAPRADDEDEDDGPLGTDYEIDATVNAYSGYVPKAFSFTAWSLNGVSPYTYTWDFGDGSPAVVGKVVYHRFEKAGRTDVVVTGKDATGATSRMQLVLILLTPEEWAFRRGVDVATLPIETPWPLPSPVTPAPGETPTHD